MARELDDGVVFVDLAPVRDPALVLDAVARTLDLPDYPGRPSLERLRRHLGDRNILLVLDNLEHLISAAPDIGDVLAACPTVKVLATSRQPLHLRWERHYPLLPLGLPEPGAVPDATRLLRSPATALFIERARAAQPTFTVDDRNAPAIVKICRRLDGLPLAIELAAAWVGPLGLEAILSRLSAHRGLPAGGSPDAPERQRTLIDAIGWSYDLLNDTERMVFRALGAFSGETPLEAIEAVCEGLRVDALMPVARLVDKNLLIRVEDGAPRFRMLETIREFAEERLELTGEAEAVRRRHAAWFLDLARQAERYLWSEHQAVWFGRIEQAHDNIRAALRWCLDGADEETGVLLAASMHRFWFSRGHIREGRRWGEIAASKQNVSDRARALALRNLAFFLVHQGEARQALGLMEQALALARRVGEPATTAWVLHGLALAAAGAGDAERSERVNLEMLDAARLAGDEALAIRALCGIASALHRRGQTSRAREIFEEALRLARPRHDKWLTGVVTGGLGRVLLRDDPAQAVVLLEESLALAHDVGHRWLTALGLQDLAGLLARSDRAGIAAALLGASESLREAFGLVPGPGVQAALREAGEAACERLGDAVYEAEVAKGRAMTVDEAVALALGRTLPPGKTRPQRPGGLTGREAQIVLDIARGLTNRQIATRLEISERTVDAHLQNIRNKLGMEKRAQIAAWASAHLPKGARA
ncbi:MAG: tetratricopeptide repeat protein [Armatimonadota bacterium]|nr:tetratricopeptide repeat protein [Armatimonadota bacterium]MDR7450769.1 tetratricopeptide repeat protein [Armatimonadota bacterium]MDR7466125.1 tetratricopeptide repeat protein [Armatimonadota bacterium]MDR7493838.1 tetratricopeptide repeat protein [Armatimonadota bacterium]MDR7499001.1 tetratricopeptide repeat protein [Armatimonadota bacterium]